MFRPMDGSGGETPGFWRPGDFRLFITHLTEQAHFATRLKRALAPYHITSFVAHKDIRPAADWNAEVVRALQTADALLALLHAGFHDSDWTDQEVGIALGRGVFVLAVRIGEVPKGFLAREQALDGRGKPNSLLAREVFHLFNSHERTRKLMAEALLRGFETSGGSNEAKGNMDLLEKMDYWDPEIPDRLRIAMQRNCRIADARRVPERLEDLIGRRITPDTRSATC